MFEGLCKIGTLLKTKFSWKREHSPNHHQSIKNTQAPTVTNSGQMTIEGSIVNATGNVSIQSAPPEKHPDIAFHFVDPKSPSSLSEPIRRYR